MRPLLVSPRLVTVDEIDEERDALDVRWAPLLQAAGLFPIVVPIKGDLASYAGIDDLAGLLLTGGNDLTCVGGGALSEARDERERNLLAAAEAHAWPVLGVCRGLQLMAVEAGMALVPVSGHVAQRHLIHIEQSSVFLGPGQRVVNSFHGFAPKGKANGYRVAAKTEDGSVEALEHCERPWVGIGWHPERETSPDPIDLQLLRYLFGTAAA